MSDPIALVTDEDITLERYHAFLRDYGAMLLPDEKGFDGQLVRGRQNVRLAYEHSSNEWEPEEIAEFARLLGAPPQAHLVLEVSREPGSLSLALAFARAFAQTWNCVLDNCHAGARGRLYTRQEVLAIDENVTKV